MTKADPDQTRLALAAVAACIVRTLDESIPGFRPTFERHLDEIYRQIRESGGDTLGALETLAQVRHFVKEL